jgi:valyl-tRNA synthetase
MSLFDDLPKAYDASSVEDDLYRSWEASGMFNPDNLPERNQAGAPYCIVMPPPNRTGTLHMGHASMLAVEDLLIRFHRMSGKRALWIPGTDHAAIATQVKVEQMLIKEGMKDPRKELGREKFLEKVITFAEESATTIRNQVRKMGSSCDWSRERYTFDAPRNSAVNEVFKMMFEDGIIERGYRVVNWDPQFQTTLSDDEVLTKETTAKLLTFTYDKDFPIAISTTRPETKFGDTAVAVHPEDDRYKQFVGQTFTPTFCGKQLSIRVIADAAVDPTFGTGALGVTPAHSMIDAEMAERHGLEMVIVIGKDARMLPEAGGVFVGMTTIEARKEVEHQLEQSGLLQKSEEIPQNLPVAERGGAAVEQIPMRQWFVRVNKPFVLRQDTLGKWKKGDKATLKELMIETVQSKQTTIVPDRFEKTYFHWINNLRDWCISRQIWFGHQIPVWYRNSVIPAQAGIQSEEKNSSGLDSRLRGNDEQEMVCSEISPGEGWVQDPDTLDTWFSSGMWTFSALGWPNMREWEEHRDYHPTAVLETGYDILFFWVARMILMSSYVLGEVPFKDVYLHGLVRDEQGRKMSKSLGNILDPLDLIPKFGTDAVRLSLVMGTTPGQDMKLSEAKIEGFRNFTNKLWNISRFILMQIGNDASFDLGVMNHAPTGTTLADQWILSRLTEVAQSVTHKLEHYELSSAGEDLRDFTWNDLADWYLEIAKIEKGKEAILAHVLKTILALWHPFMPFVTEQIWKTAGFSAQGGSALGGGGSLMIAEWPTFAVSYDGSADRDLVAFSKLVRFVTLVRQIRSTEGVEPVTLLECAVMADAEVCGVLESNIEIVKKLARCSSVAFVTDVPEGWHVVTEFVTVALNLGATIDVEKEREKFTKEIAETESYIVSQDAKLANQEFTSKAPAKVVEGMKAKRDEAAQKLVALKERLASLK